MNNLAAMFGQSQQAQMEAEMGNYSQMQQYQ